MMEELDQLMVIDRIDAALRACAEVSDAMFRNIRVTDWVGGRSEGRVDAMGDAAANALRAYRSALIVHFGFPDLRPRLEDVKVEPSHRQPVTRLRAVVKPEPPDLTA